MLVETDRVSAPGQTPGVDVWWSGKHANHGGNVQVITVPDGWPIWTSEVRPGREHDTTAVRTHTEILPALAIAAEDLRTLGDLGYEGESGTITVAFKKPKGGRLTLVQQQLNKAHNGIRATGERGNSLLKITFKALRNVSLDPWWIGKIVAASARPPPLRPRPHRMTKFGPTRFGASAAGCSGAVLTPRRLVRTRPGPRCGRRARSATGSWRRSVRRPTHADGLDATIWLP